MSDREDEDYMDGAGEDCEMDDGRERKNNDTDDKGEYYVNCGEENSFSAIRETSSTLCTKAAAIKVFSKSVRVNKFSLIDTKILIEIFW